MPKYIHIPPSVYEHQLERLKKRVEAMKQFAFSDTGCRVNRMLAYFGEKPAMPCGKCDVCRSRKKHPVSKEVRRTLEESILYMSGQSPRSIDYLINESPANKDDVIKATRRLLDSGKLSIDENGLIAAKF